MLRFASPLLLAAALSACASSTPRDAAPPCAGATERSAAVQMLFGRAVGAQGEVSEEEWRDFAAVAITPRFPDGLSVLDGSGQFRDRSGTIVRERAKIVLIVVPDAAAAMARVDAIAAAYKERFRQESVGIVVTPACAAFR
jgi:hypothetical protein